MTKDEALKLALEALEATGIQWPLFKEAITAIREALAQPEFTKHEVVSAEDWSEWVCPDPKSYLMQCCDCGLVHEAQFKVVRYKSEDEREECDPVNDPNLQAVFRMRRSEQWSPKDTAYRPGGLAQPEQEPVAWDNCRSEKQCRSWCGNSACVSHWNYTTPPQRKPLTDEEILTVARNHYNSHQRAEISFARAIEAAHGIKE